MLTLVRAQKPNCLANFQSAINLSLHTNALVPAVEFQRPQFVAHFQESPILSFPKLPIYRQPIPHDSMTMSDWRKHDVALSNQLSCRTTGCIVTSFTHT